MPQREKPLNVRSMFGHNTQRGLVMLRLGEEMVQMEPAKARQVGHWLIEAAEAAQQDEALWLFFKRMDLDENARAAAMMELRELRSLHKEISDDLKEWEDLDDARSE